VIGLNQPFPASATGDLRAFNSNTRQRMRIDQNAIATGEAVLHLDGADLKYVGGYQHYLYRQSTDGDASPRSTPFAFPGGPGAVANAAGTIIFPTTVNNYTEDHWWFSNELNLTSTGGKADGHALYTMLGGANDIFTYAGLAGAGLITPEQAAGGTVVAARTEAGLVDALHSAGAGNIVVINLPDIGKTRSLSLPVIAKVLEEDIDKATVSPYLIEEDEIVGV